MPYTVSFASPRRPHNQVVETFADIEKAKAAFVKAANTPGAGAASLTGDITALEYHPTNSGMVLILFKDASGYFITEVWHQRGDQLFTEIVTTHKSRRLAQTQIMSVFGGLIAGERLNWDEKTRRWEAA